MVGENGGVLKFVSDELKNDREIVLKAVKKSFYALAFASEELKNDKEIVMETAKQYSVVLEESLEKDKKSGFVESFPNYFTF